MGISMVFLELLTTLREPMNRSMCSGVICSTISGISAKNRHKVSLYRRCVCVENLCAYLKNAVIASFVGVRSRFSKFVRCITRPTRPHYKYVSVTCKYIFFERIRGCFKKCSITIIHYNLPYYQKYVNKKIVYFSRPRGEI